MFWALILQPGKRFTPEIEQPFHVSMACLDTSSADNAEIQVMAKYEKNIFLLCTLKKDSLWQMPLDLNFGKDTSVTFLTNGNSIVHLTGYLLPTDTETDSEEELEQQNSNDRNDRKVKRKAGELTDDKRKKRTKQFYDLLSKNTEIHSEEELEQKQNSNDHNDRKVKKKAGELTDNKRKKRTKQFYDLLPKDKEIHSEEELEQKQNSNNRNDRKVKRKAEELTDDKKEKRTKQFYKDNDVLQLNESDSDTVLSQTTDIVPSSIDMSTDDDMSSKEDDENDAEEEIKCRKEPTKSKKKEKQDHQLMQKKKNSKKEKLNEEKITAESQQELELKQKQKIKKQKKNKVEEQSSEICPEPKNRIIDDDIIIQDWNFGHGYELAYHSRYIEIWYEAHFKVREEDEMIQYESCCGGTGWRFQLGTDDERILPALQMGIVGMKVGAVRRITIPPYKAYGSKGEPPLVPPNSTIIYDVILKNIQGHPFSDTKTTVHVSANLKS